MNLVSRFAVHLVLISSTAGCMDVNVHGWRPDPLRLETPYTRDVRPDAALPEYPRPQMVRTKWQNLNGLWRHVVTAGTDPKPQLWASDILVPYPIESALSGVQRQVGPDEAIWYQRTFDTPADWSGDRVLLHFGAVDWDATVWVNDHEVAHHQGGYDPFSADITDALNTKGSQTLTVRVTDPTDSSTQPRGKQILQPNGIWYTPTTGIWQTVWLEPVPQTSIRRVRLEPVFDPTAPNQWSLKVNTETAGSQPGDTLELWVNDSHVTDASGPMLCAQGAHSLAMSGAPTLWSPDSPHLYPASVRIVRDGHTIDSVATYFAVRSITLGKDDRNRPNILLNGKPIFMLGLLDQGFWPDGIYTAPTDEALRSDIERMKDLGFNTLRKHVKVEPQRWYYWCDKLGMLVWQDMPSGDKYIGPNDPDLVRGDASATIYRRELSAMIESLRIHPSIVVWVPFNEGWGQFETATTADWITSTDPSRLVDPASGWTIPPAEVGDFHDIHVYPGPSAPPTEKRRAAVLGEFGGLGLPVEGHTWQDKGSWGYVSYENRDELTSAYVNLISQIPMLRSMQGLCAAIYTQVSDVEIEVNGLLTYDRRVLKLNADRVREVNQRALAELPVVRAVLPTAADRDDIDCRYTTTAPPEGWRDHKFDDSTWKSGSAGFGTNGTPGAIVRTEWSSSDLWLRRHAIIPRIALSDPQLLVHHDEDCEIYVNGVLAASLTGYTTSYKIVKFSPDAARIIRAGGPVTLAAHCRQTGGGQYLDFGVVDVQPR